MNIDDDEKTIILGIEIPPKYSGSVRETVAYVDGYKHAVRDMASERLVCGGQGRSAQDVESNAQMFGWWMILVSAVLTAFNLIIILKGLFHAYFHG